MSAIPEAEALRSAFPPAPWRLTGTAVQALWTVEAARARALVPAELPIVSVKPGRTLAILFLGNYGAGSTLVYHELIVSPALVRVGHQVGAWISHIYVDDPASLAGGREIWGLPKELARFSGGFAGSDRVEVEQDGRLLCSVRWELARWHAPVPTLLPAIARRGTSFAGFQGLGYSWLGPCRGAIEVPTVTPFAALGPERCSTLYHHRALHLTVGAPRALGGV